MSGCSTRWHNMPTEFNRFYQIAQRIEKQIFGLFYQIVQKAKRTERQVLGLFYK